MEVGAVALETLHPTNAGLCVRQDHITPLPPRHVNCKALTYIVVKIAAARSR